MQARRILVALKAAILMVLALAAASALMLGHSATPSTEAETTAAEMSISVKGDGTCDDPAKPAKCAVPAGSAFTLSVSVNSLPSAGGYVGMQTWIDYGNDLTYKKNPDPCAEIIWPDNGALLCLRSQRDMDGDTSGDGVYHGDATAIMAPFPLSTYVGNVVEIELNCTADPSGNTISLVPYGVPPANTSGAGFKIDADNQAAAKSSPLLVNCVPPPTPTATNTPTPTPTSTPTATPTFTPTPTMTPTPTPTKQPPPGDTDADGCTDQQENGPDPQSGGERDYLNFWDFYDVWTHPIGAPEGWERNAAIDLFGDIFGVAFRFGANDDNGNAPINRNSNPLAPPAADNKTGYHPAFDRGALIGPNPWDLGPADGSIDLFIDIFGVANQFGHDCAGAP